jgi:hypothetical protein
MSEGRFPTRMSGFTRHTDLLPPCTVERRQEIPPCWHGAADSARASQLQAAAPAGVVPSAEPSQGGTMCQSPSTPATFTASVSVEHSKGSASRSCVIALVLHASCGCVLWTSLRCLNRTTTSGNLYPTKDFNLAMACRAHAALLPPAKHDWFLLLSTCGEDLRPKPSTSDNTATNAPTRSSPHTSWSRKPIEMIPRQPGA